MYLEKLLAFYTRVAPRADVSLSVTSSTGPKVTTSYAVTVHVGDAQAIVGRGETVEDAAESLLDELTGSPYVVVISGRSHTVDNDGDPFTRITAETMIHAHLGMLMQSPRADAVIATIERDGHPVAVFTLGTDNKIRETRP